MRKASEKSNIHKSHPLVSILLNCYNADQFIFKAIDSVLKQSYTHWELIIWDDGSKDNTLKILNNYKDKRITIFKNKKNIGLGKSRIQAIKKLKGDLISIIDADDVFHPNKIYRQVEAFNKNKQISICSTWTKIFDNNNNLSHIFASDLEDSQLKKRLKLKNSLPNSSIMYKRVHAEKVGWYSDKLEYAQDYDLTTKLINVGSLHVVKEFLTFIYQPNSNMSKSQKLQKNIIEENIEISKKVINYNNLERNEIYILKNIISIYEIKLNLLNLKENFFMSFFNIIIIILKNPLLIFKYNILKKFDEKKSI